MKILIYINRFSVNAVSMIFIVCLTMRSSSMGSRTEALSRMVLELNTADGSKRIELRW
jgi:hypothetical protein